MSKEDEIKPLELNKLIQLQNQADKLIKRIRAESSENLRGFFHNHLKIICKEMGGDAPAIDEILHSETAAPEDGSGNAIAQRKKPKFSNPPAVDEFWRVFFQLQKQGVPVDISNNPSIIALHWKTLIRLANEQGIELPLTDNKKALHQSISPEFIESSKSVRPAPHTQNTYPNKCYKCWAFKEPDRT